MTSSRRDKRPAADAPSAPNSARGKLRLLPPSEPVVEPESSPTNVGDLAAAAKVSPSARARKVARLKAEIAAGTYKPDPREVAQALLDAGFNES